MVSDIEDDQANHSENRRKRDQSEPIDWGHQIHDLEYENESGANPKGARDSSEPVGAWAIAIVSFGIRPHGIMLTQADLATTRPRMLTGSEESHGSFTDLRCLAVRSGREVPVSVSDGLLRPAPVSSMFGVCREACENP
jgi:hypothetical protein